MTRINPAMDEHGEINALLFNGLTAHDGENRIVPGLAERWEYDEEARTYTFHLREGVTWHDGRPAPHLRAWRRSPCWTAGRWRSGWRSPTPPFWST